MIRGSACASTLAMDYYLCVTTPGIELKRGPEHCQTRGQSDEASNWWRRLRPRWMALRRPGRRDVAAGGVLALVHERGDHDAGVVRAPASARSLSGTAAPGAIAHRCALARAGVGTRWHGSRRTPIP